MVIVDHLSKYAYFVTLTHPFIVIIMAQVFLNTIYRLHGVPNSIVSVKDNVFLNTFWNELFRCLGTKLNTPSPYHLESNGQSEVVNKCLETYLRCMVNDKPKD